MKRDIYYIVYHIVTFEIIHVSKWYDKKTHDLQKENWFKYMNVTHQKNKDRLKSINQINNTNYL